MGSKGGDHLRRMMAWDFDPGPLPAAYHPDRTSSDLNIHYKDLFEDPEPIRPVRKHGDKGEPGYSLKHPGKGRAGKKKVTPPAVNATWMRITQANHEASISDDDTDLDLVTQYLIQKASNYNPFTRVSASVLQLILRDGRFKSQHEVGMSGGMYSPRARAVAEYLLHGVDVESEPPTIFGYLSSDPNGGVGKVYGGWDGDPVEQYGDIAISFKPEVRERTTFTLGDSLDQSGVFYVGRSLSDPYADYDEIEAEVARVTRLAAQVTMSPVPLTAPTHHAVSTYNLLDDLEDWQEVSEPYPEAQFHGGVSVSDIEHVYLPVGHGQDVIRALTQANVPFTVLQPTEEDEDPIDVTADVVDRITSPSFADQTATVRRVKGWVNTSAHSPGMTFSSSDLTEWAVTSKDFDYWAGVLPDKGGVFTIGLTGQRNGYQVFEGTVTIDTAYPIPVVSSGYETTDPHIALDPSDELVAYLTDIFADPPSYLTKHATHDQSSHGNWASPSPARTALLNTYFPDGAPLTYRLPWKRANRTGPGGRTYDVEQVLAMLNDPARVNALTDLDPADPDLYASQGSITREGVAHYLDPAAPRFGSSARLNAHPTVYVRRDGRKMILSGHHRLAADRLAGRISSARLIHEV